MLVSEFTGIPLRLQERDLSQGTKDILRRIDKRGNALLNSGEPWEDGLLDVASSAEALTGLELQLINDWIWAWRRRIIEANGRRSGPR